MNQITPLVEAHFTELVKKYEHLSLDLSNLIPVVQGTLEFSAAYEGVKFTDSFDIKLFIPLDYNKTPPSAYEMAGKIPKEFHTNGDGSLCLAPPVEIRRKFLEIPTLLGFVDNLLIPYLYSFKHFKDQGYMPYRDLPHGADGVMQYYFEAIGVDSASIVLDFLKIIALEDYRGHHECPCGSGSKIRKCHGKLLREFIGLENPKNFIDDFIWCIIYMANKTGKNILEIIADQKSKKIVEQWEKANQRNLNRNYQGQPKVL
jgi:hypothetical protein